MKMTKKELKETLAYYKRQMRAAEVRGGDTEGYQKIINNLRSGKSPNGKAAIEVQNG